MSQAIVALETPLFASIQDAGRRGWMRWGVSGGGAMDLVAMARANLLVGNAAATPCIEFALSGGSWTITAASARLAVCGGAFPVLIDGARYPAHASLELRRGQELRILGAPDAVWGYLAVQGGFDLKETLGSCATHVRAGIGGLHGRAIAAGDVLPLRLGAVTHGPSRAISPCERQTRPVLRVVLGPQFDHFEPEAIRTLVSATWQVSHRIDRMGYVLSGPLLAHSALGANIVSDGIVVGSLQVPASGQPIALMMDRQPTGGYPKIATIVTADIAALAQLRPGSSVRFRAISTAEAVQSRRDFAAVLAGLPKQIRYRHRSFAGRHGDLAALLDSSVVRDRVLDMRARGDHGARPDGWGCSSVGRARRSQ